MAYKRSTYVFPTEEAYENARNHIYNLMYNDYNDSDKIYWYGYWGSCSKFDWDQCYRADIYSDCDDPEKAASIFREHGGRFYE
ncbi:MAG: hypothetical protein UH853_04095 [Muribaculaceae bacterium]|nr:hypothetical protein [Muribaculaceae bacterium]